MFNTLTRMGASAAGDYEIQRSLRFNDNDSAYLNRTPSSAGNLRTWTFSFWVKRCNLSISTRIFSPYRGGDGSNESQIKFNETDNDLQFYDSGASSGYMYLRPKIKFRDTAAWYHIVIAVDTTQGTASNRGKIYVNGVQQTAFTTETYGDQNQDMGFMGAQANYIGAYGYNNAGSGYYDGYLTEMHWVDGTQLTAASFGETNADTGQWIPKKYDGSHGSQGWYLKFSDNSGTTATTLGKDSSGNSNNWTPNNFSVAAAPANDSVTDTPTNNFCTWNVLTDVSDMVLANGSLNATNTTDSWPTVYGTIGATSGKFYFEATNTDQTRWGLGWSPKDFLGGVSGTFADGYFAYSQDPLTRYATNSGTAINGNPAFTTSDVLQVAIDITAGKIWYGIDNTWVNDDSGNAGNPAAGTYPINTFTAGTEMFPKLLNNKGNVSVNWGQQGFAHTPPSGFETLSSANLATPTIEKGTDYFDSAFFTGTSGDVDVTGLDFQPNLVWIKARSNAQGHSLGDSVRGGTKLLQSNTTGVEMNVTELDFNSDGFTSNTDWHTNGYTYLSWSWKEAATAGFDIVSYTGTGSARTVSHNLGVVPEMMIIKNREETEPWWVYSSTIGASGQLRLNEGDGKGTDGGVLWNSTAPTSSVFTVNSNTGTNGSDDDIIAYLFSSVAGYSKFGSYEGIGGTDGPFVNLGFKPALVIIKNIDADSRWWVMKTWDSPGYNLVDNGLAANETAAEQSLSSIDMVSNGFKVRNNGSYTNENNGTHIYMAFAESPFKYSTAS